MTYFELWQLNIDGWSGIISVSNYERGIEVAQTIYQKAIYELIDFREEVKEKFEALLNSTNNDITFSKNPDGSIVCYVKYKNHSLTIRLDEKEVYQYAVQSGKKPSDAIEDIIKNNLYKELLKEKE